MFTPPKICLYPQFQIPRNNTEYNVYSNIFWQNKIILEDFHEQIVEEKQIVDWVKIYCSHLNESWLRGQGRIEMVT